MSQLISLISIDVLAVVAIATTRSPRPRSPGNVVLFGYGHDSLIVAHLLTIIRAVVVVASSVGGAAELAEFSDNGRHSSCLDLLNHCLKPISILILGSSLVGSLVRMEVPDQVLVIFKGS